MGFRCSLGAQCEEKNRGLGEDYFRAQLKSGGCHVLIDGLDETPDEASRERLAKLIREAAAAFDGCRFVVTSRPEGKVPIQGFDEALIGDLQPEAIRAFLAKLARQLYPEDETRERTFREDLEAAVNGRREIRKMTRNPVMLTALAVLQHNNVKLPEKRVDLYGSILEWLSKQRAKPGRMTASDCLLRLRELALEMQNHEEGRRKQAPLAWAGEKLMKRFANREAAERFLRAEQADSGIVVSRGKEIAYWHLTFQEYLAALEVAGWEDADQYKLLLGRDPKVYKPEWRETVLLYGGLLHNMGPRKVDALVRKVLDKMGKQPGLADRAKCIRVDWRAAAGPGGVHRIGRAVRRVVAAGDGHFRRGEVEGGAVRGSVGSGGGVGAGGRSTADETRVGDDPGDQELLDWGAEKEPEGPQLRRGG